MVWEKDKLQQIAEADDLHISPFREDGTTYGTPTWIWSVVVEDGLYVRGYNGTQSRWYQAAVRQKAGRVTVQFTNNDSGMTHSFALYRSKSDLDQPLAATTIATGPNVMSITADLTPGDYYFQCQVHPDKMNGALTASP